MDCVEASAAMERGAVEEVESAEFKAHLLRCEECAEEWDLIDGLRELGATLTPERLRELAGPCPTEDEIRALACREAFGPQQFEALRIHLLWCDECERKHFALRQSLDQGRDPDVRPAS